MKHIALALVSLCAANAFAVSWDQADPTSGWKKALPAAHAAPAARPVASAATAVVPALPPKVAKDALEVLKTLAAANDPKNFGFKSLAELKSATLGRELRLYFVGLTDLASFQKGQDPFSIMQGGDKTEVILVEAGGTARCRILFRYSDKPFDYGGVHRDAGWHAEAWGEAETAKGIDAVLQKSKGIADEDDYLIEIPALGQAQFVAQRAARQRVAGTAYALWDNDGETGLKAGASKSVDDLFAELQPKAQAQAAAPSNGPGGAHP